MQNPSIAEFIRNLRRPALLGVVLLLVPSLISAFFAVWSAATEGKIEVFSIGRWVATHETVPWQQGWARLASPLVLVAAAILYLARGSTDALGQQLALVLLSCVGIAMCVSPLSFSSFEGTAAICSVGLYVSAVCFVDARFGRLVSVIVMIATVVAMLIAYAYSLPHPGQAG
ncbi:hypothetical protein [Piscinibacterium candidicorallinum]|uniref:Uncharacterized protein n=1 Tax=Piscinibacterium candidicorallinum TaxID=1793872 RepID=A0ABV7H120_9BURK